MWVGLKERLVTLSAALRTWQTTVVHEHGEPLRIGAAVAFGVFVGCSPFFGIQTLIGLGLAPALRLNRVAVLVGLQVSIPPVTPFLLFATAQVGALFVRGDWLPLTVSALRSVPTFTLVSDLFLDLLVGGGIVGAALGASLGLITTYFVRRHRLREGVA